MPKKSEPEPFAIGDVAALVDVAQSTLRYYDRRGLVSADRRQSGHRHCCAATTIHSMSAES